MGKNKADKTQNITKKPRTIHPIKWVIGFGAVGVLLLLMVYFALQLSYVQTKIAHKLAHKLTTDLGYNITLDQIKIVWYDRAVAHHVSVIDSCQNTILSIDKLFVDFKLSSVYSDSAITIDYAQIEGARVYVTYNPRTRKPAIAEFKSRMLDYFNGSGGGGNSMQLIIKNGRMVNSFVLVDNIFTKKLFNQFDYNHFSIDSINAKIANFKLLGTEFWMDIEGLNGHDVYTKLRIDNLNTKFHLSDTLIELTNLDAYIGHSYISDKIAFAFKSYSDFSKFNSKVDMQLHFNRSVIHTADLALFAPSLAKFRDRYLLEGYIEGKVEKFNTKQLDVGFGAGSMLNLDLQLDGLPDFFNTMIHTKINNAELLLPDLRQYMNLTTYRSIEKFSRFGFKGFFTGFPLDFVAYGAFDTPLGHLESDCRLVFNENENAKTYYRGSVKTYQLDLGRVTNNTKLFQKINMEGFVEGYGFELNDIDLKIKAKASNMGVYGYNYKNISVDAKLKKYKFEGQLSVADTNLTANLLGTVDFEPQAEKFEAKLNIKQSRPIKLNLSDSLVYFASDLDLNCKGLTLDSIYGSGKFTNTQMQLQQRVINVPLLSFTSDRVGSHRDLKIKSSAFDFEARGNFTFRQLTADISDLVSENILHFKNDENKTTEYYKRKQTAYKPIPPYDVSFKINLRKPEALLRFFVPKLYISGDAKLMGFWQADEEFTLMADITADTVKYGSAQFFTNRINIATSKPINQDIFQSSVFVFSKKQKLGGLNYTSNLVADVGYFGQYVDFRSAIQFEKGESRAELKGRLDFLPQRMALKLLPSEINFLNQRWTIDNNNLIELMNNGQIAISGLSVQSNQQLIAFQGKYSKNTGDTLNVNIKNFDLSVLKEIANINVLGNVNAQLGIANPNDSLLAQGNIGIAELKVNDYAVGQVDGSIKWLTTEKKLALGLDFKREGLRYIRLRGQYSPYLPDTSALVFNISVNQAPLKFIEPFLTAYIADVEGEITGVVNVTGSPKKLSTRGKLYLSAGAVTLKILGCRYFLTTPIDVKPDGLHIDQLTLTDERNQKAYFAQASLTHKNYQDFRVDLSGRLDKIMALNTTPEINPIFYGKGFVSGQININGPLTAVAITGEIITEAGSRCFVPINFTRASGSNEFITYTDSRVRKPKEKTQIVTNTLPTVKKYGATVNLNIEVTPDAVGEVIFDARDGDIIRGAGNGKLKFTYDTRGDVGLFGEYNLIRGGYNFSLSSLINKEFNILPGSTVLWSGNPYQGQMSITATYFQNVSLGPIIVSDTSLLNRPELRRKYPGYVDMTLSGPLLQPEIGLKIRIEDYPSLVAGDVTRFLSRVENDEQELNRQVFSLLVLRQLSPEGSFAGSLASTAGSLSEMMSNQLGSWLSQVDENLEVNIDLNGFDQDAFNTFQLRLSYSALNGRLRLTRDGSFTNVYNQATANSITGDITAEYLLTRDGNLRIKMFRKNNQNLISTGLDNQITTSSGLSIIYSKNFNRISDLWKMNKPSGTPNQPADTSPNETKSDSLANDL